MGIIRWLSTLRLRYGFEEYVNGLGGISKGVGVAIPPIYFSNQGLINKGGFHLVKIFRSITLSQGEGLKCSLGEGLNVLLHVL